MTDESLDEVDLHIAVGRRKHDEQPIEATGEAPAGASEAEKMQHKLRTPAGRAIYKMRKAIVEPIFGQIKEARGFRRFSFRGLERVSLEWDLICLTHNLLKLFRAGVRLQTI